MYVLVLLDIAKGLAKGNLGDHIEGKVLGFPAKVEGAEGGRGGEVFGVDEVDEVEEVHVYAGLEGGIILARVLALGLALIDPRGLKLRHILKNR